jgi:hypothetical protein
MIKFNRPKNLNGTELLDELKNAGVTVTDLPMDNGKNGFWLNISEADKTKAEAVVDAHNGTTVAPQPTVEEKLASVGLNLDDLKTALGL